MSIRGPHNGTGLGHIWQKDLPQSSHSHANLLWKHLPSHTSCVTHLTLTITLHFTDGETECQRSQATPYVGTQQEAVRAATYRAALPILGSAACCSLPSPPWSPEMQQVEKQDKFFKGRDTGLLGWLLGLRMMRTEFCPEPGPTKWVLGHYLLNERKRLFEVQGVSGPRNAIPRLGRRSSMKGSGPPSSPTQCASMSLSSSLWGLSCSQPCRAVSHCPEQSEQQQQSPGQGLSLPGAPRPSCGFLAGQDRAFVGRRTDAQGTACRLKLSIHGAELVTQVTVQGKVSFNPHRCRWWVGRTRSGLTTRNCELGM
jgi:hypothetical protein